MESHVRELCLTKFPHPAPHDGPIFPASGFIAQCARIIPVLTSQLGLCQLAAESAGGFGIMKHKTTDCDWREG